MAQSEYSTGVKKHRENVGKHLCRFGPKAENGMNVFPGFYRSACGAADPVNAALLDPKMAHSGAQGTDTRCLVPIYDFSQQLSGEELPSAPQQRALLSLL